MLLYLTHTHTHTHTHTNTHIHTKFPNHSLCEQYNQARRHSEHSQYPDTKLTTLPLSLSLSLSLSVAWNSSLPPSVHHLFQSTSFMFACTKNEAGKESRWCYSTVSVSVDFNTKFRKCLPGVSWENAPHRDAFFSCRGRRLALAAVATVAAGTKRSTPPKVFWSTNSWIFHRLSQMNARRERCAFSLNYWNSLVFSRNIRYRVFHTI